MESSPLLLGVRALLGGQLSTVRTHAQNAVEQPQLLGADDDSHFMFFIGELEPLTLMVPIILQPSSPFFQSSRGLFSFLHTVLYHSLCLLPLAVYFTFSFSTTGLTW